MYPTRSPRTSMLARKQSSSTFNSNPDESSSTGSAGRHFDAKLLSNTQPVLTVQPPSPASPRQMQMRNSGNLQSVHSNERDSSTIRATSPPRDFPRASFIPHAHYDDLGSMRPPSPRPGEGPYPALRHATLRNSERLQFNAAQPLGLAIPVRSREPDYSYMDDMEDMQIRPSEDQLRLSGQLRSPVDGDSEFARRPMSPGAALSTSRRLSPPRKKGRFKRMIGAFANPFRAVVRGIMRIARAGKGLSGKKQRDVEGGKRDATASGGWDFRDPTPAPTSIRQSFIQNENDARRETSGTPMPEKRYRSDETFDNRTDTGSSRSSRSRSTRRSPGLPSVERMQEDQTRIILSDAPPTTATTQAHPISPMVRSSIASAPALSPASHGHALSPRIQHHDGGTAGSPRRRPYVRDRGEGRSSKSTWSRSTRTSISQGVTSLLQMFLRARRCLLHLYNLPWIAAPTKRVAADFIPAVASNRSRYRVHRAQARSSLLGACKLPQAVLMAADEAEKMEPSEGKSWYRPSAQQIEKRRAQMIDFEERGVRPKVSHRHRPLHPGHAYYEHSYDVPYICSLDLEQYGHSHAQHHPYGFHASYVPSPNHHSHHVQIPQPVYMAPHPQMPHPMPNYHTPPRAPGLAYSGSLKMPVPSVPQRNFSIQSHSHRNGEQSSGQDHAAHASSESSHRSASRPPPIRPAPFPLQSVDPSAVRVDVQDPRLRQQALVQGFANSSSSEQRMYPPPSWVPMHVPP